jgi:2-oxo-4-hydroxy-4-carboxy-5-ureidoimidazoline decarboxylase
LSLGQSRVYLRKAVPNPIALDDLNRMDATAFTAALAQVFEHAPWVAARAARKRPFASRTALHETMKDIVRSASDSEQMALICGHPELAGKAAVALTKDSASEQRGAGLDRLTRAEFERFHALNTAYRDKFGFPFIMAVKGRTKDEILDGFAARLDSARPAEIATALDQIGRIAGFRLTDLVAER